MARNKTEPRQKAVDLRGPLLGSQVQKKDPNLFQAINQLLEQVQKLQDRVTELEQTTLRIDRNRTFENIQT